MQEIISVWRIIKEISPVLVGFVALLVYILQARRKVSEAASLIVMQVEELKKKIQEIGSYIVDGKLDSSAFYESQPLFEKNYWNEYKHYFVNKIDHSSFTIFNEFYNCASEILEQQQFMKQLQKDYFLLTQHILINAESSFFQKAMKKDSQEPRKTIFEVLVSMLPEKVSMEQKNVINDILKNIESSYPDFYSRIINHDFERNKNKFHQFINNQGLTSYLPIQSRITIEKHLKREASIEIIGCKGYNKMKRIAAGKFFM